MRYSNLKVKRAFFTYIWNNITQGANVFSKIHLRQRLALLSTFYLHFRLSWTDFPSLRYGTLTQFQAFCSFIFLIRASASWFTVTIAALFSPYRKKKVYFASRFPGGPSPVNGQSSATVRWPCNNRNKWSINTTFLQC